METKEIIEGSKLIAEYMGMVYIPFSTDLQHKAGWWSKVPKTKRELFYSKVNGNEGFICRRHSDLMFYNSLDSLIPVIQKIEKESESKLMFSLFYNKCELQDMWSDKVILSSYTLPNWSNNVFSVIISFLAEKI